MDHRHIFFLDPLQIKLEKIARKLSGTAYSKRAAHCAHKVPGSSHHVLRAHTILHRRHAKRGAPRLIYAIPRAQDRVNTAIDVLPNERLIPRALRFAARGCRSPSPCSRIAACSSEGTGFRPAPPSLWRHLHYCRSRSYPSACHLRSMLTPR